MEPIAETFSLCTIPRIDQIEGVVLSQQQRDTLAVRINQVILERKRWAKQRRMLARLRQLQNLERTYERHRMLREDQQI